MENLFNDKYQDDILGTNNDFDRVIIKGSIIPIAYPKGLQIFLNDNNILLKNIQTYATRLADILVENAKSIAKAEGLEYIHFNHSNLDKEKYIKAILKERGFEPGMVAVLCFMELANSFDTKGNKNTHKRELVQKQRVCRHIYFYFIDEQLGLCHFRVQTFFPFKVQIYYNGREQLARRLDNAGISYQKDDNCFNWIDDPVKAQEFSDDIDVAKLHALFDKWVERYVPILKQLRQKWQLSYHWSNRQIEYAADIIFKSQQKLDNLFLPLLQYAVISVLPDDIMSFLGKKLKGSQFGRIETTIKRSYPGYRIKHKNGAISIKMYNKSGNVLRIEVTFNNVSELKIEREVRQRDGQTVKKLANMKKSIYSMEHIIRFAKAAAKRYLDFLSKMEDNSKGVQELCQLTERQTENSKSYKGFNPLNREDFLIFRELLDGMFIANGFTNKNLKTVLSQQLENLNWTTSKTSRLIKRFRVFGLVKKVNKRYRYFLTEKGRLLIILAVKLRTMTAIPAINTLVQSIALKTP